MWLSSESCVTVGETHFSSYWFFPPFLYIVSPRSTRAKLKKPWNFNSAIEKMTSSCEKVTFPIPDDTESNFVVSWTENKPPTPLDGFGPDIVRRTLQIPQKNGDVYEITLAIYEVTK